MSNAKITLLLFGAGIMALFMGAVQAESCVVCSEAYVACISKSRSSEAACARQKSNCLDKCFGISSGPSSPTLGQQLGDVPIFVGLVLGSVLAVLIFFLTDTFGEGAFVNWAAGICIAAGTALGLAMAASMPIGGVLATYLGYCAPLAALIHIMRKLSFRQRQRAKEKKEEHEAAKKIIAELHEEAERDKAEKAAKAEWARESRKRKRLESQRAPERTEGNEQPGSNPGRDTPAP